MPVRFRENFRAWKLSHSLCMILFLGILISRRWEILTSPQVWGEDGTQILSGFITQGWPAFFSPVNGYLITSSKIISTIALNVTLTYYPFFSTLISWIFIALVGWAVLKSPTKLKGKWVCAIAIVLVPSDPEVIGPPLYSFWWASLLLFLLALWNEDKKAVFWRLGFLLLGGLSSPVIIIIIPLLYLRLFLYWPIMIERVIAFIGTAIAGIQLFLIMQAGAGITPPLNSILINFIPKMLGTFFVGNIFDSSVALWGAGIISIATITAWFFRQNDKVTSVILIYLLAGSIGLTIARVDPAILHPEFSGPRYFFFPYVCMSWILVQSFYGSKNLIAQSLTSIFGLTAVLNSYPVWSRTHDDLQWNSHIYSCRLFVKYAIPVQTDGNKSSAWRAILPGDKCAALLERDLFASLSRLRDTPTFPYLVSKPNLEKMDWKTELVNNTMTGADFDNSKIEGFRVIGSYDKSDADTGEVVLRLHRGSHLLYRSGPQNSEQYIIIEDHEKDFIWELPPSTTWVSLDFSNSRLPDVFLVKIQDRGKRWGEWSAIAIRN